MLENGVYLSYDDYSYVKGLREYTSINAIGTYKLSENQILVCNIVNLTSKEGRKGNRCFTELYRPGQINGCNKPALVQVGNETSLSPKDWQVFVDCFLGGSPYKTDLGLNLKSFNGERAAFDFAFTIGRMLVSLVVEEGITEKDGIKKLYSILTLKEISSGTLSKIETIANETDYQITIDSMLSDWFNSSIYKQSFIYNNNVFIGSTCFTLKGRTKDDNGNLLSDTTIKLFYHESEVLSLSSNSAGDYNAARCVSNDVTETPLKMEVSKVGFSTAYETITLVEEQYSYSNTFELLAINDVNAKSGGKLYSSDSMVEVDIPSGAVNVNQSFAVSAISAKDENSIKFAEFNILPSYEFGKPVKIKVHLTPALKSALDFQQGSEDLALFVKEGDDWKLLEESIYDPQTEEITAITPHFSTFILGPCGKSRCVTEAPPHELASIFKLPYDFIYPKEIKANKQDRLARYNANGWTGSTLSDPNLLIDCNANNNCDFLENTLTLSDLNITLPIKRTRLQIDSITLLKSRITSNATLMVQEEQCAHNPLAVMPQMKVVAIKKIDSDLELEMKFDNVRIEYRDFHFEYKCTKFLFWKTCYPNKLKFTREDRFSHTAKLTINNFKQSIIRDSTFTNLWKLGPTFSKGSRNVQIEPAHLFNTNHRLRYRNALLTILNEKVIESRSAMQTLLYFQMRLRPYGPAIDIQIIFGWDLMLTSHLVSGLIRKN